MRKGRIGREAPSSKTLVSHLLSQFSYVTVLTQQSRLSDNMKLISDPRKEKNICRTNDVILN